MPEKPRDAAAKTPVHCPKCGRFMFNISITSESIPVGGFGRIEDFKCPNRRCPHRSVILMGVADKERRGDKQKIESELKETV